MTQQTSAQPHPLARLGVIVVAAGQGARLGAGVPKAFVSLGGRTLLDHAIVTVTALAEGGQLVLVVPEDRAAAALARASESALSESGWSVSVVAGGRERHESVRFGIEALLPSIETVLVHDAARPLASANLFTRVIAEVRHCGEAVVPGIPVADTLKRVAVDGVVHETVPRADLVAVQTPQGFPRELLEAAHSGLRERTRDGADTSPTDDAEVVQQAGGRVRIVPGELRAHKLTTPGDAEMLAALWHAGVAQTDGIHAQMESIQQRENAIR